MHPIRLTLPRLSLFLILLAASFPFMGCDKKSETPATTTPDAKIPATTLDADAIAALTSPAALCLFAADMMGFDKAYVLRKIAVAMAEAGDKAGAKETFSKAISRSQNLLDSGDKARALCVIAEDMAKAGDTAGALAVAGKLASWDEDNVLRKIAKITAQAGDKAEALAVAEKLKGWDKADALREIALAMAQAGDKAGAKETFSKAVAAAEKLDGLGKTSSLLWIAGVMAEAGDKAGAKAVLSQALAVSEELRRVDPVNALLQIAEAMAKTGDMAGVPKQFSLKTSPPLKCCGGRGTWPRRSTLCVRLPRPWPKQATRPVPKQFSP